ncbi:GNAT family N-acetyltransferase [Mycobacterium sp.]|uniref:GNAT family N-acetyltransferase n=1 Tax=Mycobacterium sp. TaxID=1785 RepID=UPI002C3D070E|nr:GNAT family N-acetyltransferase [Mycobacterium sp.]HTQ19727.1 GNAT family N-acetyltransferase [Mycobacterium sp.]
MAEPPGRDETRRPALTLRAIEPADGPECTRIIYEAFGRLHDYYRFPRDFPTLEDAERLTGNFIEHPSIWGVVAEDEGRIVGSNFLDQRGPITGVGPITVDPEAQGRGVGRRLMEAVMERGAGARGIRLFQDAFNMQSLSLYASLGFEVKEPAIVMCGTPKSGPPADAEVRSLEESDLPECEQLCLKVHGFERTNELRDALRTPGFSPSVVVRAGEIRAYATTLTFFPAAYAVAETERDMRDLIAGAATADGQPASFLLPTRQAGLLRWCLREGLRAVKPVTYMSLGEYAEPNGCWIPSLLY